MPTKLETAARAKKVFADARASCAQDCKTIAAAGSAADRLGGGATAIESIEAFAARSHAAQARVLDEIAGRLVVRGGKWRKAMEAIADAAVEHMALAPGTLENNFRLARLPDTARVTVQQRLAGVGEALAREREAFPVGWTSPQPRPWRERHATFYALLVACAGGVIMKWSEWLWGLWTGH